MKTNSHPTKGHCYVLTEALYHLWGKERGYKPHVVTSLKGADDWTHWYLKKGDHIIDPSREQWGKRFSYGRGRGSGFLTTNPSRRCKILIERMKAD